MTKDYPDEPRSGLDQPDAFRLNIAAPSGELERIIGSSAHGGARSIDDVQSRDVWFPHPVYGAAGWLSVVNPDAERTEALRLLEAAHRAARERYRRRTANRDAG